MMRTLLFTLLLVCCTTVVTAQTQSDTLSLKVEFKEDPATGQYAYAIMILENKTEDIEITIPGKRCVFDGGACFVMIGLESEDLDGTTHAEEVPGFCIEPRRICVLKPQQRIIQGMSFFSVNAETHFIPYQGNISKLKRMRIRLSLMYNGVCVDKEGKPLYKGGKPYYYRPQEGICSEWIDLTGPKFDFLRKKK